MTKNFLVFFSILLFVLSPISPSGIFSVEYFNAKADSATNITGYQVWDTDKIIDSYITIASDATLIIRPGVKVSFKNDIAVYGTLVVSGTKEKPVIFKKSDDVNWGYSVSVAENGKLIMRNADVSGGGYVATLYNEKSLYNKAMASGYVTGCIDVSGGWLDVETTNFHDNQIAVYISDKNLNRVKVNRSKFINSSNFDVDYIGSSGNNLNFQYNWWDGQDGSPRTCDTSGKCWFEKFNAEINFSNWLASENFIDPVIIIPGILGSEEKNGNWKIDPIFHTYDNLYKEISYVIPENYLFTFAYDWRKSNIENAKLLKTKIQEIKQQKNWPKVDIIAHSMGGLLAREYIESDNYGNDIDQLITLGTPNYGAPEAYLKWEAGAFLSDPSEIYLKHRFSQESEENGYEDIFHYIQDKIPSIKELLPTYGYLYDVDNDNKLIEYNSANYPINSFLENLNTTNKKNNLLKVEFNRIIGNVGSNESTVSGFNVIKRDMGSHWKHGYPLSFEIPLIGDRGIVYDNGDGTVPITSARSDDIYNDNLIEINSGHRNLPTDAQKNVVKILTGTMPILEEKDTHVKDILIALVHSPIDIQIISPSGKKYGKDFENNTDFESVGGSYYTGFNTENEFITIPNPEDGEYKILAQGTGDGDYKIEVAKISENENNPQNATESTAEIIGTATNGSQEEKKIEITGNEISVEEFKDITPPAITAEILEKPNENGWYKSDVTVRFIAGDNESGIEGESQKDVIISNEGKDLSVTEAFSDKAGNTAYKTVSGINIDKTAPAIEIISPKEQNYLNNQILKINYGVTDANNIKQQAYFDGNILNSDEIDLSPNNLKKHTFSVSATDEAGNKSEKSVTFGIITDIDSIISNVDHYYNLGFITNQNTKNFLEIKLQNIQKMEDLLAIFEVSLLPKWAKEIVVENLKRIINHEIDNLIFQIKNQKNISKNITFEAKNLLIESLNFIKK